MRPANIAVLFRPIRTAAHHQADHVRRALGYRILYALGDSHIRMLVYVKKHHDFQKTELRVMRVGAATAMGLNNPQSQTNARQLFEAYIAAASPRDHLMFMLGEVDCGYAIWSRADRLQVSVDSQLEYSLSNYQAFVLSVFARGYTELMLASVPLPTLSDNQDWGVVADQRRTISATLRQRTDLTFHYNERLRLFCQQHSFVFFDFERDITNPSSRLLNVAYRDSNPLDHHLSNPAMLPVLIRRLNQLGFV